MIMLPLVVINLIESFAEEHKVVTLMRELPCFALEWSRNISPDIRLDLEITSMDFHTDAFLMTSVPGKGRYKSEIYYICVRNSDREKQACFNSILFDFWGQEALPIVLSEKLISVKTDNFRTVCVPLERDRV